MEQEGKMIAMLTALFTLLGAIVGGVVWWMKQNKSIPTKIAELERKRDEKFDEWKKYSSGKKADAVRASAAFDVCRKLSADISRLRKQRR